MAFTLGVASFIDRHKISEEKLCSAWSEVSLAKRIKEIREKLQDFVSFDQQVN